MDRSDLRRSVSVASSVAVELEVEIELGESRRKLRL